METRSSLVKELHEKAITGHPSMSGESKWQWVATPSSTESLIDDIKRTEYVYTNYLHELDTQLAKVTQRLKELRAVRERAEALLQTEKEARKAVMEQEHKRCAELRAIFRHPNTIAKDKQKALKEYCNLVIPRARFGNKWIHWGVARFDTKTGCVLATRAPEGLKDADEMKLKSGVSILDFIRTDKGLEQIDESD
jgi:hypothetical protein